MWGIVQPHTDTDEALTSPVLRCGSGTVRALAAIAALAFLAAVGFSTTGAVNANFTVTLSAASGRAVTVEHAAADDTATAPGDYSPAPATLTFTAGQRTKTVTVTVKGDVLDEVNETYAVTLASATNATVGDGTGVGTITDDDPTPTLTVADLSVAEGNAGTANATFAVTLSPLSGRTVTVDYATAYATATAPSDYEATSGTLTFVPGQTAKSITVRVKGDSHRDSWRGLRAGERDRRVRPRRDDEDVHGAGDQ
jgi:hypothetical protein